MKRLWLIFATAVFIAGCFNPFICTAGSRIDRINGLTGGVAVKAPVKVATTENITLSGVQTIDGVALTADESPRQRVLVKNQTDSTENGIYDVNSGAWTRSPDFDGDRDVANGTLVLVTDGSDDYAKAYYLSASNPVDIGSDSLSFVRFDYTILPDLSAGAVSVIVENITSATFYHVSNYSSLAAAVSDIGTTPKTLVINTDVTLSEGASVTIPETMTLVVLREGSINGVSGGSAETLTINGTLVAGAYQIFGSDLTVTGAMKVEHYLPQWFGAVADGVTDDTAALHRAVDAMDAGKTLFFISGVYHVTSFVVEKQINLVGEGTWGVLSPDQGAVIESDSSGVPVMKMAESQTSHWKHQNIRFLAGASNSACVEIEEAQNGAMFDRCMFKSLGADYNVQVNGGYRLDINNCFSTGAGAYNIYNTGCATIYVTGGLNDVATNGFVYQGGAIGGNVFLREVYIEWPDGSRSIVVLNNSTSPATVDISSVTQTSATPYAMVRQLGNVGVAPITIHSYHGQAPTYLYADDNTSARNVSWTSRMSGAPVVFNENIVNVPFAANSYWTSFTADDATPSVASGKFFRTGNTSATTITHFDDGVIGQEIVVLINDSNTTIDFSGTNLKGNGGADFAATNGDCLYGYYDRENWHFFISQN